MTIYIKSLKDLIHYVKFQLILFKQNISMSFNFCKSIKKSLEKQRLLKGLSMTNLLDINKQII